MPLSRTKVTRNGNLIRRSFPVLFNLELNRFSSFLLWRDSIYDTCKTGWGDCKTCSSDCLKYSRTDMFDSVHLFVRGCSHAWTQYTPKRKHYHQSMCLSVISSVASIPCISSLSAFSMAGFHTPKVNTKVFQKWVQPVFTFMFTCRTQKT